MVKKIDLSRDKIDFGTEKIVGLFLNLNYKYYKTFGGYDLFFYLRELFFNVNS